MKNHDSDSKSNIKDELRSVVDELIGAGLAARLAAVEIESAENTMQVCGGQELDARLFI